MYCPCLNFRRHVFWESVICLWVQYSLDSSLSIFSLVIHFSILEKSIAIISKLCFLLCLMICFSRNLIGPLSGVLFIEYHHSFLIVIWC